MDRYFIDCFSSFCWFLSFDRIKRKFERFSLFEVKGEGGEMAFTLYLAQIWWSGSIIIIKWLHACSGGSSHDITICLLKSRRFIRNWTVRVVVKGGWAVLVWAGCSGVHGTSRGQNDGNLLKFLIIYTRINISGGGVGKMGHHRGQHHSKLKVMWQILLY